MLTYSKVSKNFLNKSLPFQFIFFLFFIYNSLSENYTKNLFENLN